MADERREQLRLRMIEWRKNHPGRAKELSNECYARNKVEYAAKKRIARLENGDKIREQMRASYYRHREERLVTMLTYAKEHPIQFAEYSHNRRAKIRGAFVEFIDRTIVFEASDGDCYLCQEPLADQLDWHLDHIIPLSSGGLHAYSNVAATHPLCNLKKGSKVLEMTIGQD